MDKRKVLLERISSVESILKASNFEKTIFLKEKIVIKSFASFLKKVFNINVKRKVV